MLPYPKEILPSIKYKRSFEISNLEKDKHYFLHRRSELERSECFYDGIEDIVHLKPGAITHLLNLSVNIVGGKFVPGRHALWVQKNGGELDWEEEEIIIDNFKDKYILLNGDFPQFWFCIKDLQGASLKYPRTFNKETDAEGYAVIKPSETELAENGDLKKINEDIDLLNNLFENPGKEPDNKKKKKAKIKKNVEFLTKGRIQVEHRPTKLNYWHCQVYTETQLANGSFERTPEKKKAQWIVDILQALDEKLRLSLLLQCPAYTEISPQVYMK